MKVAIVGGRTFNDYAFMKKTLDAYHQKYTIDWVYSGGARGADSLAEQWCKSEQIPGYTVFLAQWNQDGKRAGYRRNLKIVECSEIVIAFPTPSSKGTWHSIKLAKRFSIPYIVCYSPMNYPDRVNAYELWSADG